MARDYYGLLGVSRGASDAEIKRAITKGISRNGRKLQPPMGFDYYNRMTETDLNAIVAYLRTVPPQD